MLGRNSYSSDEIEACRDTADALLAAWQADEVEDSTLENLVFGQAVIALDAWFVHRLRGMEGKDANALNEVRVLARSLMENGGTVMEDTQIALDPDRSVLGLRVGEPVRLTLQQYTRLSDAFFREIERRFRAR